MKQVITLMIMIFSLLWMSGCIGQPTKKVKKNTYGLWSEYSGYDDENEGVDVSDLNKSVSSSEEAIVGEVVPRIEFPVKEYQVLRRSGRGTVKGRIYVEDMSGKQVVGSKTRLYLNPVTSYSKQWYEESYLGGKKMGEADSRLFNYLKFTASDNDGNYAFYGVPSGKYYLIGTVTCGYECGFRSRKNIRLATEIAIYGNEVVTQELKRHVQ